MKKKCMFLKEIKRKIWIWVEESPKFFEEPKRESEENQSLEMKMERLSGEGKAVLY